MSGRAWLYPLIGLALISAVLRSLGFAWGPAVFAALALACLGMLFYGLWLSKRALTALDEPVAPGQVVQGRIPMDHHQQAQGEKKWSWRTKLALLGFLGVAAFFLLTEHRAHVFGALPYVLLLLCFLLHLFGHGGIGHPGHSPKGGRP